MAGKVVGKVVYDEFGKPIIKEGVDFVLDKLEDMGIITAAKHQKNLGKSADEQTLNALTLKNLRDQRIAEAIKAKPTTLVEKIDDVDIFADDVSQVPVELSAAQKVAKSRYEKAKAKVNPEGKKIWNALSFEDKQKHLLEQFELMASGQKTKEAVANELGYVNHNFSTIEKAANLKYKEWLKGRPEDIISHPFKVKNTNQANKKLIDPETGYVMKTPSRSLKRQILNILENTKALKPDDYPWGDDEFSLAFANEYRKVFPSTFKGTKSETAGSNKYQSDKELAQKMLEFQGSNIKMKNLPVTLRYDESGVQFDISKGGVQSNKASWDQIDIGEPTIGLATKHAKNQLLDLDGTWNSVQTSIYADPKINYHLDPLRQAGAAFDIDHVVPVRFGGTNDKNNLRFIIKGSHLGKTLSPDETLMTAAVKNKSAMEEEVYKLNKKMINLVVNKQYKEALDVKQNIQNITNNFKETNPNTDFGVGMPYVVIKTGKNTADNVRLIDYLELDNATKNIIETDFIVYDSNFPNAGKPLEKTAEELRNMYQFFIDASGGKLDKNLSKGLFEFADGGFASIEEVLEY